MSISADPIVLKKIALAKQIFHRALIQSASLSNLDKMMSAIMFDLSTETMLNSIVSSLDATKTPSDGFPSLLNQVDFLLSNKSLGPIPDRANIVRVHNIRNDAQHDARYPNNSEISDCQTYTRDFLKKVSRLVWNLDFDKLSLTDLVQDVRIQTYLKNSETAFHNKDYKVATQQAGTAVDKSLRNVGRALVGPAYFSSTKKIMVSDWPGKEPQPDDDITTSLERMSKTLRLIALGLSLSDYIKFKEIVGDPSYTLGNDEPYDFYGGKESVTADDSEFALAYAIDSVMIIESKVGDLEKPFGKDRLDWF